MSKLETYLKEVKGRSDAATPGPWIWADWTILKEDRPAQFRKEPHWSTCDSGSMHLVQGPMGRKYMNPESIAEGCGYDESDINIKLEDAAFIAHARTDVPVLLEMLETLMEIYGWSSGFPESDYNQIENLVPGGEGERKN